MLWLLLKGKKYLSIRWEQWKKVQLKKNKHLNSVLYIWISMRLELGNSSKNEKLKNRLYELYSISLKKPEYLRSEHRTLQNIESLEIIWLRKKEL